MTPADFEWTIEKIEDRITKLDKMFEEATGWGSWMSEASAERRGLVSRAAKLGITIVPKFVLQTAGGRISD